MKSLIYRIKETPDGVDALPDGTYSGLWGGYVIEIEHNAIMHKLDTVDGVRGWNIPVVVQVFNGVATFDTVR